MIGKAVIALPKFGGDNVESGNWQILIEPCDHPIRSLLLEDASYSLSLLFLRYFFSCLPFPTILFHPFIDLLFHLFAGRASREELFYGVESEGYGFVHGLFDSQNIDDPFIGDCLIGCHLFELLCLR